MASSPPPVTPGLSEDFELPFDASRPSRVLIVDDEPVNLAALRRILKNTPYEILEARSGRECIELATEKRPDLILLDVVMPDLDGVSVCRTLRERKETNAIPVIFVTATDSREGRLQGLEAGAVDYLGKPVDPEETLAKIKTQLSLREVNLNNLALNIRLQEVRRTAAIGAITQGIAHNLNNMLGVVTGYIELMKMHAGKPEKMAHYLSRIEEAVSRIVGVLRQLNTIAFNNLQTWNTVQLEDLLAGAAKRARSDPSAEGIRLLIENRAGNPAFRTNLEALEDALARLLINAFESYESVDPPDPEVLLAVDVFTPPESESEVLRFSLLDRGCGMKPDFIEHAFEPFISTKRTVGVGMGLTVARHAIRRMGGDIRLKPRRGGGIEVEFTHPLHPIDG
ncbi:MAG: hybrid sensor histidine kinase/response regulator [Puniceicoccaceae bacterium]|nr:MAG: hybrid sensor histidine kinase/response regulator [Puniceicoccaceae bacterium]